MDRYKGGECPSKAHFPFVLSDETKLYALSQPKCSLFLTASMTCDAAAAYLLFYTFLLLSLSPPSPFPQFLWSTCTNRTHEWILEPVLVTSLLLLLSNRLFLPQFLSSSLSSFLITIIIILSPFLSLAITHIFYPLSVLSVSCCVKFAFYPPVIFGFFHSPFFQTILTFYSHRILTTLPQRITSFILVIHEESATSEDARHRIEQVIITKYIT